MASRGCNTSPTAAPPPPPLQGTAQEARQRKDELLAAKVKLVVEAQKNHTDTSKLPPDVLPHSDVVEEVPDAPLWAGDGDLSTTGRCGGLWWGALGRAGGLWGEF